MHLDSENYIIFITALEAYKYKMLSFKLTNKSIFFQQYMNDVLWDFLNDFCQVYLDDILIYSKTRKKHRVDWSRQVEYLSSSWVLDSSRLNLSQNSWLEYLSWVRRFDSSIQVESEGWNWVSTWNSRFNSSRHEAKYY